MSILRLSRDQLAAYQKKQEKPSKYGNRKVALDGRTFDSAREAKRYTELKLLEQGGEIKGLTLQPEFVCSVNGVAVCKYRADFSYHTRSGASIVEDVKGMKTEVYRLKKKLVRALFGIEIHET